MSKSEQRIQSPHRSLPTLRADLLLVHTPAFFDFRQRRDVYFPFLGTAGDVPITPLYEYFPIGFKTLQRYLGKRGHDVKIINFSTILLRFPLLRFDDLVNALDARLIGIDLHWMVHVQGSLAVAKRVRELRPDIPNILGGISSTYYAEELIHYSFIDMVMRGYDTHEPMTQLVEAMKLGRSLSHVPNLIWKDDGGPIRDNGFTYIPESFSCGIDWSRQPRVASSQSLPILEITSTQNAGCTYHCSWCGGSRETFQRIFKCSMARKMLTEVEYELETINHIPGVEHYHLYMNGSYNESPERMHHFLNLVGKSKLKSISYEQFLLTPDDILQHMVSASPRTTITLSPESHDPLVARLSGRGVYTNDEMEVWIERALDFGIDQIDIWYFIGMPNQPADSVYGTIDYCQRLLEKFKGQHVQPMICPMIPFLDPASTFFEYPEGNGYRVFYRTVEEHRCAMERASIINRINYETRWLTRKQLVEVGFRAVRQLMAMKANVGMLPKSWVRAYNKRIDDALEFIPVVHQVDCIPDLKERAKELDALGGEIVHRNNMIFFDGVMNQAFPVNRHIGGRWFDEMGWDPSLLQEIQGHLLER